tara:strand:+ start:9765 stop:10358 length:594 start_codon:yes stop_codon:yes gene_type:complete
MKKTIFLLALASFSINANNLFDEYPVMQKYEDNKLAYHHAKSESKSKVSVKDKMTDVDKCVSAAVNKYPGHILSMEAEIENDRLIYEFDIKTKAGPEIEIECDAIKHTLHDYEVELAGNDPKFTKAVKISEQDAKDIALAKYNGKIVDVEYSMENNTPAYEFDIYVKDKGHEYEVEVDGLSGKILETEIEIYDIGAE